MSLLLQPTLLHSVDITKTGIRNYYWFIVIESSHCPKYEWWCPNARVTDACNEVIWTVYKEFQSDQPSVSFDLAYDLINISSNTQMLWRMTCALVLMVTFYVFEMRRTHNVHDDKTIASWSNPTCFILNVCIALLTMSLLLRKYFKFMQEHWHKNYDIKTIPYRTSDDSLIHSLWSYDLVILYKLITVLFKCRRLWIMCEWF